MRITEFNADYYSEIDEVVRVTIPTFNDNMEIIGESNIDQVEIITS